MAKQDTFDNDGDEMTGPKMQSEAKLPAKKGQSKFGGLSSGLKKKPERSGMAKSPALKIAKKKGL